MLVERPDEVEHSLQGPEDKRAWFLQANLVATPTYRPIKIVLSTHEGREEGNDGTGSGEGFLENLKERDRVFVWAREKVCWIYQHTDLQIILTIPSAPDGRAMCGISR